MKVFISTSSFGKVDKKPMEIMRNYGVHFEMNPHMRTLTEDEITHFLEKGKYIGLIAGLEPLNKTAFSKAKSLKVISRVGAGIDNIDLDEARRRGIKIFNTPDALRDAVAELTVGLILDALRKITIHNTELKTGVWQKRMGNLLKGKKVGILGCGRIGTRVAEILTAFGAKIIYSDICDKSLPYPHINVESLLREADIVALHASGTEIILDSPRIAMLKRGAIVINTSRGTLIDEEALYHALKDGHIAWACLDVFAQEPYSGPLKDLENVTLTPHIGSYAKEARVQMEIEAVYNLLKGLGVING